MAAATVYKSTDETDKRLGLSESKQCFDGGSSFRAFPLTYEEEDVRATASVSRQHGRRGSQDGGRQVHIFKDDHQAHDHDSADSLGESYDGKICQASNATLNANGRRESHNDEAGDHIWLKIRKEAQSEIAQNPTLLNYYWVSILARDSLESALAYCLATKLDAPFLKSPTCLSILTQDTDAIRDDLRDVLERYPAWRSYLRIFLNSHDFLACQTHRLAHKFWSEGNKYMALAIQHLIFRNFGVKIHPQVKIGCGIVIDDQATGIVIGRTAVIGDNVTISNNVTRGGTHEVSVLITKSRAHEMTSSSSSSSQISEKDHPDSGGKFGRGTVMDDHAAGVVIRKTADMGDNVTLGGAGEVSVLNEKLLAGKSYHETASSSSSSQISQNDRFHPGATIGCWDTTDDHDTDAFIGKTAVIGDNVTIPNSMSLGVTGIEAVFNEKSLAGESYHEMATSLSPPSEKDQYKDISLGSENQDYPKGTPQQKWEKRWGKRDAADEVRKFLCGLETDIRSPLELSLPVFTRVAVDNIIASAEASARTNKGRSKNSHGTAYSSSYHHESINSRSKTENDPNTTWLHLELTILRPPNRDFNRKDFVVSEDDRVTAFRSGPNGESSQDSGGQVHIIQVDRDSAASSTQPASTVLNDDDSSASQDHESASASSPPPGNIDGDGQPPPNGPLPNVESGAATTQAQLINEEPQLDLIKVAKIFLMVSTEEALALLAIWYTVGKSLSANSKILFRAAELLSAVGFLSCLAGYTLQRSREGRSELAARFLTAQGCVAAVCAFTSTMCLFLPEDVKLFVGGFISLMNILILRFLFIKKH